MPLYLKPQLGASEVVLGFLYKTQQTRLVQISLLQQENLNFDRYYMALQVYLMAYLCSNYSIDFVAGKEYVAVSFLQLAFVLDGYQSSIDSDLDLMDCKNF